MSSSAEVVFQENIHFKKSDNRECFLQAENSSNRGSLVMLDTFFLSVSELVCFILIKSKSFETSRNDLQSCFLEY